MPATTHLYSHARAIAATILFTSAVMVASDIYAFECPTLAAVTYPDDYRIIEPLLPAGDDLMARENIVEAVYQLRQRGTPDDVIVNSLFAAYCPRISAKSGLSASEKDDLAAAFLAEANRVVFASGD